MATAPPPAVDAPHAALRPFVARYLDVAVDVPAGTTAVQRVSPPGGATLSFRWSGTVAHHDVDGPVEPPPLALTGPIDRGGITVCSGALRLFVVFLTPAGAHDLFGLAMPSLVNRSVDAAAALGPWVRDLADAVAAAPDARARRRLVDGALRARAASRGACPGLGALAAAAIADGGGRDTVEAVAARLGVATRTLRRRFVHEVGLPPKAFARWVRFVSAHEFLAASSRRRWADAVVRFGYADQAHLVREYRHFAGQPPTHLAADERLYDPSWVAASGAPSRG